MCQKHDEKLSCIVVLQTVNTSFRFSMSTRIRSTAINVCSLSWNGACLFFLPVAITVA